MPTTRDHVVGTLAAHLWQTTVIGTVVIAAWRRRRLACTFDSTGRLIAASVSYPLDRNAGQYSGPLEPPLLRAQVLAFIRGEEAA